ncbi:hypothetical protein E2C01_069676 [Portunus trituberculatus]|uniref:Uncharacterized protein n=1 Tax=Portunus trituberculatus TaxID=210409 RepID=A0A5B7HS61_PORTR|nr:hypothetical protein [Portunus trituberculatus]
MDTQNEGRTTSDPRHTMAYILRTMTSVIVCDRKTPTTMKMGTTRIFQFSRLATTYATLTMSDDVERCQTMPNDVEKDAFDKSAMTLSIRLTT